MVRAGSYQSQCEALATRASAQRIVARAANGGIVDAFGGVAFCIILRVLLAPGAVDFLGVFCTGFGFEAGFDAGVVTAGLPLLIFCLIPLVLFALGVADLFGFLCG